MFQTNYNKQDSKKICVSGQGEISNRMIPRLRQKQFLLNGTIFIYCHLYKMEAVIRFNKIYEKIFLLEKTKKYSF